MPFPLFVARLSTEATPQARELWGAGRAGQVLAQRRRLSPFSCGWRSPATKLSTNTVECHARQAFGGHNGRWNPSSKKIRRIVDPISHFGRADILSLPPHVPADGQLLGGSAFRARPPHLPGSD